MKFFEPRYEVQLHRVGDDNEVLSSWSPKRFRRYRNADRFRQQLYVDNKWGGPGYGWPLVTIKEL